MDLPHGFKLWTSLQDVQRQIVSMSHEWQAQEVFQRQLLRNCRRGIDGFCAACLQPTTFRMDRAPRRDSNWREVLECGHCNLVNRWRACVHLFRLLERPAGTLYITEQTTDLYAKIAELVPGLIGSEFVADSAAPGELQHRNGIDLRHEDVTRLSFGDSSLAAVLSFDVIEHVPDFRAALREFARVLQPGGLLLLSAPFGLLEPATTVRARRRADGSIEHLLPPLYHGDPLGTGGVLCYQDFGWDLVDHLRDAGISEVGVITCWNPAFGYLGNGQSFLVGRCWTGWPQSPRSAPAAAGG